MNVTSSDNMFEMLFLGCLTMAEASDIGLPHEEDSSDLLHLQMHRHHVNANHKASRETDKDRTSPPSVRSSGRHRSRAFEGVNKYGGEREGGG